jgi:hypothetical protein
LGGGHVGEEGVGNGTGAKPAATRADAKQLGEACSELLHVVAGRRDRLWEALDPVLAKQIAWADADPDAMRALLRDPIRQRQILAALDDVVGPADQDTEQTRQA